MQLILGVDEARFRELELAGLPCVHEVETAPKYETPTVIRWYIAYRVRLSMSN